MGVLFKLRQFTKLELFLHLAVIQLNADQFVENLLLNWSDRSPVQIKAFKVALNLNNVKFKFELANLY